MWQFTMTHDAGIGILGGQILEQGEHGSLLGLSPGVVGTTFLIEAAFVADANGMLVVMTDMCASNMLRAALMVLAIAGDIPVITVITSYS